MDKLGAFKEKFDEMLGDGDEVGDTGDSFSVSDVELRRRSIVFDFLCLKCTLFLLFDDIGVIGGVIIDNGVGLGDCDIGEMDDSGPEELR